MDNRTYVVTMGEVDDCYVCKNFDVSASEETIKDISFVRPTTVMEFVGHPDFYTKKDLAKAREEGQIEAWELARKIAIPYGNGGYSYAELNSIFGKCDPTYLLVNCSSFVEAQALVEAYERNFQIGDIIEHEGTKEKRVIVNKDKYGYYTLAKNGRTFIIGPRLEGWHKTGKSVNVADIMNALKED